MVKFLKEYALWILIPFVLVLGLVAFMAFWDTGSDSVTPFTYEIF